MQTHAGYNAAGHNALHMNTCGILCITHACYNAIYQRGSTEQMSWNVTFLMQIMFVDITRWFMGFGAKRTTPVVWTEIQFKFWHWVSTLQATTPQPGPLFIPKQEENFLYDTKLSWGLKSIFGQGWFSTFLAPFLLIFLMVKWAKMGYLAKYCSVLPHFCCSDIFYWNVDDSYKNDTNQVSGWWDMREWW